MSRNTKNTRILFDFLNKCKVSKGEDFTHTSMGAPFGSFNITKKKRKTFMKLYVNAINEGAELHLTEAHRNQGPIVIDIDWKYKASNGDRIYTDDDIRKVIEVYNNHIRNYVAIDDDNLEAFVLEKPIPTVKGDECKDGIHIEYPYICCTFQLQHVIRADVIKEFEENDYFGHLNLENQIQDVFDQAVIKDNNWLLYGSFKPDKPKYELTKVYNTDLEEVDPEINDNNLYELLSIRKFSRNNINPYIGNVTKENIVEKYKKLGVHKPPKKKRKVCKDIGNNDNVRKARILVEMLSDERADASYRSWIEVGWCLHNIHPGLLDEWIQFSKKSTKFKPGECERLWFKMRDEGFNIGSLYRWAQEDSPDDYKEFKTKEILEYMKISVSGTSHDVAKAFFEMFKFDFVCASIKHKMWYAFQDHKWVCAEEAYPLYDKLNNDMVNEYIKLSNEFGTQASQADGDYKDIYLNKQILAQKISTKLRTVKFKNDVITECKFLFYDPKFLDKIDENRHLLCFNNGVYDLDKGEFREGRPEDYITLCTNIDYIDYDPNDRDVLAVEKFFGEIQPDSDMRNYVLDLLSSCLQGHTPDEKFHIWTGSGCHLKDTKIMMSNGSYKLVQDVMVGDTLMGDDCQSRKVLQLFNGEDRMYTIKQSDGIPYTVNGSHRLALKAHISEKFKTSKATNKNNAKIWTFHWLELVDEVPTKYTKKFADIGEAVKFKDDTFLKKNIIRDEDIIPLTVDNYLKMDKDIRECFKGYKTQIDFPEKDVPIDPYIMGYWLGNELEYKKLRSKTNNTNEKNTITTHLTEVMKYFERCQMKNLNLDVNYGEIDAPSWLPDMETVADFYYQVSSDKINSVLEELVDNKYIPNVYKFNNRDVLYQLLAGMVDGMGMLVNGKFQLRTQYEDLAEDIVFICRILQFNPTISSSEDDAYYKIEFSARDLPCLLSRNQVDIDEDIKVESNITVEYCGVNEFYGFEISGNNRYLLEDGTTTYNSNGKSLTISLFQQAFGDYASTLPITLLTNKRASSNAATPEMARMKGKRFAVFQEPEGNDKIHVGHMKELTGNDKVQARALFKEPIEFYPQFKAILTCNRLPFIPSNDGGTWRRIRVVPYEMKFVDNPKEPWERKIDRTIKEKLESWKEPMMSILIHRFKNYKKNGLIEPLKVTNCTDQYQMDSDFFQEFINEYIDFTSDKKDALKQGVLYTQFKNWFKEAHSDKKCPGRNEFRYDFEDKFGKMTRNGWTGMRFKEREDDDELGSDNEEEEEEEKPKKKNKKKKSPKKSSPKKGGGITDALDNAI